MVDNRPPHMKNIIKEQKHGDQIKSNHKEIKKKSFLKEIKQN